MNIKDILIRALAAVSVAVAAVGLLVPLEADADRSVEIRVDSRGFHPSTVQAERGEPLTLVFLRTEERGCGNRVKFPEHDIQRDLPVNERVPITITPNADRIAFTCGMGHMRGTIVAEEEN